MDLAGAWQEVASFQEHGIVTAGAIHGEVEEYALVRDFLSRVPIAAVFGCLQDASDRGDSKQVKQACTCIARVLSARSDGSPMFFEPELAPFILAGLQHGEKQAQELTLNQFVTHLGRSPTLDQVATVSDLPIVAQLCSLIAEDDLEVASKSSTVLEMLSNSAGAELFKSVLDSVKLAATTSGIEDTSVEYMRYIETIANICAQKDAHMQYGISSRAVDLILNCLKANDPLFLMNVVDLVPKLGGTALGVQHILHSGTLQTLLGMVEDPFVGGSVVRLIGELSATASRLRVPSWNWSDPALSKAFLDTIEAKLESSDQLQQIAAMDGVAAFASSSDRELDLLLRHQTLCKEWLQCGGSMRLPVKVNCLHSIARILDEPTALKRSQDAVPVENAGVWSLCQRLFDALGAECRREPTMTYLMDLLKQPFEELRIAVFSVLRAVAAQNNDWGVRALLSYGGFFEFLLDRNTEPTKETREWKFAILDAVLASPFQSRLDATTLDKLKASMRRGPYVGTGPASMQLEAS